MRSDGRTPIASEPSDGIPLSPSDCSAGPQRPSPAAPGARATQSRNQPLQERRRAVAASTRSGSASPQRQPAREGSGRRAGSAPAAPATMKGLSVEPNGTGSVAAPDDSSSSPEWRERTTSASAAGAPASASSAGRSGSQRAPG